MEKISSICIMSILYYRISVINCISAKEAKDANCKIQNTLVMLRALWIWFTVTENSQLMEYDMSTEN